MWKAISNPAEFGAWFRAALVDETFMPGHTARGHITYPGCEHLTMEMHVERIEPERLFAFRWHPYAIDPDVDYSGEPTTLVEFTLEEIDGGTRLTVVESGFDAIPAARRDEAWRMNSGGWEEQMRNIARHLDGEG